MRLELAKKLVEDSPHKSELRVVIPLLLLKLSGKINNCPLFDNRTRDLPGRVKLALIEVWGQDKGMEAAK